MKRRMKNAVLNRTLHTTLSWLAVAAFLICFSSATARAETILLIYSDQGIPGVLDVMATGDGGNEFVAAPLTGGQESDPVMLIKTTAPLGDPTNSFPGPASEILYDYLFFPGSHSALELGALAFYVPGLGYWDPAHLSSTVPTGPSSYLEVAYTGSRVYPTDFKTTLVTLTPVLLSEPSSLLMVGAGWIIIMLAARLRDRRRKSAQPAAKELLESVAS
jgi:hypothetical protein